MTRILLHAMSPRIVAALLLAALCAAAVWCGWMWWPVVFPPNSPSLSERWVECPGKAAGFDYHFYRVTLRSGAVVHVEATHYVWQQGAAISFKDAATQNIVWSTTNEAGMTVEREP